MEGLARELRLKYRVFDLDDPVVLDNGLQGLAAVLHSAGPFIHTSKSVVDACLRSGVHYLDVMGEVSVFEALAARDAEAKVSGGMLFRGPGSTWCPPTAWQVAVLTSVRGYESLALHNSSTLSCIGGAGRYATFFLAASHQLLTLPLMGAP